MKENAILIFLIFSFLIGCSLFDSDDESEVQEFLFEVQYTNWAWGFSHNGTYIDNKGNVYSFKFDSSEQFVSHEKDLYSREELKNKYDFNKELIDQLYIEIIETKRKLIKPAIQGLYSDTLNTGADMGQLSYSCFILEDEMYQKIELKTEGDWMYQIETPEADSLIKWLESIIN